MKKIYLLSLLSIFSMNLFCQINWTKHPDNPVMIPGTPGEWDEEYIAPGSVIYYDNTYHMWYTGGSNSGTLRIGHATSPDGVTWKKDTINNPVLDAGPDGDWDENYIYGGGVLVIDSILHMWYGGHSGSIITTNFRIGHATSPDGVTWTKDTNNPVLDMGPVGTWDGGWVSAGSVIFDGSEYHMWYSAHAVWGSGVRVGHATSPDGVNWTKDPSNPVLIPDTSWESTRIDGPVVIFDGTTYRMWYSGGKMYTWRIGYATSEDGSVWTKYGNNPVLRKGSTESWDDRYASVGSVIDSSGVKYKMWYGGGQSDATGSIGYAESSPLVSIPDTAFLHALIDEGVDTNGDSLISYAEAEAVKSLDVSGNLVYYPWIITDMTGVEAFINLDTLNCALHSYYSIDVSNMKNLIYLDCSESNLMSLDVSNNPKLRHLDCSDQSIPELDVSNNPDLVYLNCHGNLLTSLDLTKNPKLELLWVQHNQLTSLNLSHNSQLTEISLHTIPTLYQVCTWIVPFPPSGVHVDTSDSPNVYFTSECNTGIKKINLNRTFIYPNPVNDLISIERLNPGLHYLEITSLNGQLMYSNKIEGPTHQIDFSSFQKGLYFITIRSRDFVRTEKIIKL